MRRHVCLPIVLALAALCILAGAAHAAPWKFGVIADTQWIGADDGRNPWTCAVDIINQVNRRFIEERVKLVVAVGDLADKSTDSAIGKAALDTRVTYTQALYNAGIGFFPLRGNHDGTAAAAVEFLRIFPQTQNGLNNNTPPDAFITTPDDAETRPVGRTGATFYRGSGVTSPSASLKGLSYAFRYGNATFVLLDQFTPPDGSANSIDAQQGWITRVLKGRPQDTHAFVFGHKGLITENHVDVLFGKDPASDPAGQDAFITALAGSGGRYYLAGHDHMHDRTRVTTTDGAAAHVTQIICASDSSKFYIPAIPSNDDRYNVPAFGRRRQTPLGQELNTVGYYIFTVDGPRVTVDYYSAPVNPKPASGECAISTTPTLSFNKRETFGYSLNGKEFLIAQGQPYTVVEDSFSRTTARILSGANGSTGRDGSGRPFVKAVDTGWVRKTTATRSDILSLWGMGGSLGEDRTDVFTLSMTYDPRSLRTGKAKGNGPVVGAGDGGTWVNAVDKNRGGPKQFIPGPWKAEYGLGTYGVDPDTQTAWAVIDHGGDFAVVEKETP